MSNNPPQPPTTPNAPVAVKASAAALYDTPQAALKAVREDYLYWTGRVTDTSLQLSLAVIAANWAVFGTVDAILTSFWARLSMMLIVVGLGVSLIAASLMGTFHGRRIDYAESDGDRWNAEFEATAGRRDPWPFTHTIEMLGSWQRLMKTWLPIAAGLAFLIALFRR
jgi:hypothetical protein